VRSPERVAQAVLMAAAVIGVVGCTVSEPAVVVTPSPVPMTPSPPSPSPPVASAAPPPGVATHDCKALSGQGLTYEQIFAYWIRLGSPQDMDDDRDGWPCETVYGQKDLPDLPAGTHDCTILFSRSWTYEQMFAYWVRLGSPQDMDDDHDGWPCETVYGDQN
jgi:hypothetical protein